MVDGQSLSYQKTSLDTCVSFSFMTSFYTTKQFFILGFPEAPIADELKTPI